MLSIEDATAAVAAVRGVGERAGVPIVFNARTDVFLGGSGDPAEAVDRANAYLGAGADCAFAIGLADRETVRAFRRRRRRSGQPARAPGRSERERAPGARRPPRQHRSLGDARRLVADPADREELFRSGAYETFAALQPYPDLDSLLAP